MKLSGGVEWGLHCCVVLSQAREPVPAARLAEFHAVSPTYLAKQLQALARGGIVTPRQGQVGGYTLTRPAEAISVLDVVRAIDGDEPAFRCTEIRQQGPLAAPPENCVRPCAIARTMAVAEQAWRSSLAGVSVADLAADVQDDTGGTAMPRVREWLGHR